MKTIGGKLVLTVLALIMLASGFGWCDGTKLVAGDIISVIVDEEKDMSKNYQVDKDGAILMPMVGAVKVAGISTSEASAEITKALLKVMLTPQVTVLFVERAKMQVFVVGQVRKPGLVEVGSGDKVIQALAQAGYDDSSDLARVSVRRGDQTLNVDLSKYLSAEDITTNIELESGDTVVVPRIDTVGTVMVLGQVTKTGSVPITRGMTFRELMGLVGDVTTAADTDKITIKRNGATEAIPVQYKRAMDGDPQADIALQQGDTIYVAELEKAYFTVMGAVNNPGPKELKGKVTLSEAIGQAGGPIPNVADPRKIQLARPSDGSKPAETINADLNKVIAGTESDPAVKRGDVIYVAVHKQKTSVWQVITSVLPFGWIFR